MSPHTNDVTGLGMAFGTLEEGRSWVGRCSQPRQAWFPIDRSMVLYYCSLVEDANPRYWEGDECPPGLLMTLGFNPQWTPTHLHREDGLFAVNVPLPGHHIINASTTTELDHADCESATSYPSSRRSSRSLTRRRLGWESASSSHR